MINLIILSLNVDVQVWFVGTARIELTMQVFHQPFVRHLHSFSKNNRKNTFFTRIQNKIYIFDICLFPFSIFLSFKNDTPYWEGALFVIFTMISTIIYNICCTLRANRSLVGISHEGSIYMYVTLFYSKTAFLLNATLKKNKTCS
jgi:hypothetical protein